MVTANTQALERKDRLRNPFEEARVVLPGVQALFAFRLITVSHPSFAQKLVAGEQRLHRLALALVLAALAAAFCITPAALHEHAEPGPVTLALLSS